MAKSKAAEAATQAAVVPIDGTDYRLVYSFNAIAEAEERAKCNLLHGLSATLLNTMTAGQLRGMFYAALRANHADLTIDQAGGLIRLDTLPGIVKAIGEAFVLSMPDAKKNPTGAGANAPAAV